MGDAYGAAIIEVLSKEELQTNADNDENLKNSTNNVTVIAT